MQDSVVPAIDAQGWLSKARRCASPNCDDRPVGAAVSLAVVHGISLPPGRFGGPWIDALFTNRLDPDADPYFAAIHQLRVSSHLLLRRNGEMVQYVPFDRRAWHAGVSAYAGQTACNDFAVGIELEGCDTRRYTSVQYRRLGGVLAALCRHYPALTPDRVVGHSDIAPGRKTDPGPAFDWQRLRAVLLEFEAGDFRE